MILKNGATHFELHRLNFNLKHTYIVFTLLKVSVILNMLDRFKKSRKSCKSATESPENFVKANKT